MEIISVFPLLSQLAFKPSLSVQERENPVFVEELARGAVTGCMYFFLPGH